jgi:hypothetical protein
LPLARRQANEGDNFFGRYESAVNKYSLLEAELAARALKVMALLLQRCRSPPIFFRRLISANTGRLTRLNEPPSRHVAQLLPPLGLPLGRGHRLATKRRSPTPARFHFVIVTKR